MILKGTVHKYQDNVNTDEIIPARYLNTTDHKELAAHCMEDIDADFINKVKLGDIIVAGENFGCGSSREHAPICIKAAGVSCVVAKSFARIFYRNAINIGLPLFELKKGIDVIDDGEVLEVDTEKGTVKNITTNKLFQAVPFSPFVEKIIEKGGLMNYVRELAK